MAILDATSNRTKTVDLMFEAPTLGLGFDSDSRLIGAPTAYTGTSDEGSSKCVYAYAWFKF